MQVRQTIAAALVWAGVLGGCASAPVTERASEPRVALNKVVPCLWFQRDAEQAARRYCELVPNSRVVSVARYGPGAHMPEGTEMLVQLELGGTQLTFLNGGPQFQINEALSLMVRCDDQAELDRLWSALGEGGREKAPAALSRKVAQARLSGDHTVEVWGDGEQSRSFMYIDDCVRGSQEILAGDNVEPVNLGSAELVTINQMIGILEEISGIKVEKKHDLSAPQGVRGRNSDNTMFHDLYGWEPSISLHDGLERTYAWIYDQIKDRY